MEDKSVKSVTELFQTFFQDFNSVCHQYQRNSKDVNVVAVSKLQSQDKIQEAYQWGQRDFGENYVQEAVEKIQSLQLGSARWHLIGPLQSNKINKIVGKFFLIHSVDSLKLAQELSEKSIRAHSKQKILCQINFANEASKSGFNESDFLKIWPELQQLQGIEIHGLMCMPPLDNPEPFFAKAQSLCQELQLPYLSMGTTSDWKLAIKYGSTHIRIGTALFGERT
jgi:pyridoxal phosphate enzyme (YggS family)